ncbi:caspase, EACC1-associated type [Streptomyces sp. 1222.5]|uniref:caspase, EACC1-associated type n=1 Tax=Streptomyces sp. 1222.5 TaxID=1881026 RepID=UPI003D731FC1
MTPSLPPAPRESYAVAALGSGCAPNYRRHKQVRPYASRASVKLRQTGGDLSVSPAGPVADFCAELRRLVRACGVQQMEIARLLGKSQSSVSELLNGRRRTPPDWSDVQRIVELCAKWYGDKAQPRAGVNLDLRWWRLRHSELERTLTLEWTASESRAADRQPSLPGAPKTTSLTSDLSSGGSNIGVGAGGGLTAREYAFASPDDLGGADAYRTFCNNVGLPVAEGGYGMLLAETSSGGRVTALTRDIGYVRNLAIFAKAPGFLAETEIPAEKFPIKRAGWPDDWKLQQTPLIINLQSEPTFKWLPKLLRATGISQKELADAVGVTTAAVSAWVTGRAEPRIEVKNRIVAIIKEAQKIGIIPAVNRRMESTPVECWQYGSAVLIGVAEYENMRPVPSIRNNIASLRQLMVSGLGIPEASVFPVEDPKTRDEIHEAIEKATEAADPARGGLLVYFAGHGWTDPRGRLMLGMVASSPTRTWSALDFDTVRDQIAGSQIGTRVVILDSCYSGAALDALGAEDLASAAAVEGTYVLTSVNATTAARAPREDRYTTFTGQLIAALSEGIPGGPNVITTEKLFRHIEHLSREYGWPMPARQIGRDGDRVELTANRWRG